MDRGYVDHRWLTFQQARAVGGTVRRGERGVAAFFLGSPVFENPSRSPDGPKGEAPRDQVMRCTLFNVAQCDALPPRFSAPLITRASCGGRMRLKEMVAGCGLDIRIGGSQA
ncbi:ArdC-like ssDNA-binding domain-containing protein, partial [Novosphingobium anseongense]|uniref:ArdC-like ssDNA-binding domain-containing protein n=1 Tax=Novosphingobium anseongense TaxID=3133436 RepID=UPI003A92344B